MDSIEVHPTSPVTVSFKAIALAWSTRVAPLQARLLSRLGEYVDDPHISSIASELNKHGKSFILALADAIQDGGKS